MYRDQEFSSTVGSRARKRIEDVRLLRAAQFPEDASPLAHPIRPETWTSRGGDGVSEAMWRLRVREP